MVECTFRTVCICFSALISADWYASLSATPSSHPYPARREGERDGGRETGGGGGMRRGEDLRAFICVLVRTEVNYLKIAARYLSCKCMSGSVWLFSRGNLPLQLCFRVRL